MYHPVAMKRILNLYIIREITTLFLLGIVIFTLVLLMGRMLKLTDMVISRGVPFTDLVRMIAYLMPSFLIFTIPMAFLLAVLLAFGRLSADNEITVLKSAGVSLVQLLPPVMACGSVATLAALAIGVVGIPWGNNEFKRLSLENLTHNVTATIRERVFWDDIPGIVLYTDRYDDRNHTLRGVLIHDGRDQEQPLTIFAEQGTVGRSPDRNGVSLLLSQGSIHAMAKGGGYRLVNFEEYIMTVSAPSGKENLKRNESDMDYGELRRHIDDPTTPRNKRLGMLTELHSRFSVPFSSLVFAVLAVPLGMQNRRSGKSSGFTVSIIVLVLYYILLSLMRSLAERALLPAFIALWLPNLLLLGLGWYLLKLASLEKPIPLPSADFLVRLVRRTS